MRVREGATTVITPLAPGAALSTSLFTGHAHHVQLRIEAVAHNIREFHCGRLLDNFPEIVRRLRGMLEQFMEALSCIDQCFIGDEMLERLPLQSRVGKSMVGGIACVTSPRPSSPFPHHPTASPPRHWPLRPARSAIKAHPPTVPATQPTI